MNARITVSLGVLVALLSPAAVRAAPVRVEFSGYVQYFDPYQEQAQAAALGWSIPAGTLFSGFFAFDDAATPVLVPADENVYLFLTPAFTTETSVGTYSTVPAGVQDLFGVTGDGYSIAVSTSPGIEHVVDVSSVVTGSSSVGGNSPDYENVQIDLRRALANPFPGGTLGDVTWNRSDFEVAQVIWTLEFNQQPALEIWGVIDEMHAVPEPTALASIAIAALALAALGFRRARS